MKDKVYHSTCRAAFAAIILGIISASFVLAYHLQPMSFRECIMWWMLSTGTVFFLSYPCKYTLTRNSLKIRVGLFRITLPYGQIDKITPNVSTFCECNMGYGLRGLIIRKNSGLFNEIGISPQNQEEFLEELDKRIKEHQS